MEAIERDGDGFVVRTNRGSHRTRSVLLTMGRRGTPRKLEVPGEESPKVVYRLIDPAQYDGQAVLVVGGGDSALEAAIALAERTGHRRDAVVPQRGVLARQAEEPPGAGARPAEAGRIRVRAGVHRASRSSPSGCICRPTAGRSALRNEAVIVCAGGLLPTPLLQKIGIHFDTKHGSV